MLISFEGLPGAGKTTQSRRLADRFRQNGVTVAYLPDLATLSTDPLGDTLVASFASSGDPFRRHSDVLTDTLLAAAIRAQITAVVIAPAAATHQVVIEDRGVHTMYAYSLATLLRDYPTVEIAAGLRWLRALGAMAGRRADTAVWLRLPVAAAIDRAGGRDGVRYSGEQQFYLAHVDDAYRRLASNDPSMLTVDVGDLDRDGVHELVYREISRRIR